MHSAMASDLATQRRHEMASRALAASQVRAAAGPRGPRRLEPGAFFPRFRLSWSRTALSPAADGGRRGRSWVIIISATRAL